MFRIGELFIAAAVPALLLVPPGEDLRRHYKATLDFTEEGTPRTWTCTAKDVWRVSSFHYENGRQLNLELGPSTVVFGVHAENVVWAALLPDYPGVVSSTDAAKGEHVASVWMRFHPSHLTELFPSKIVEGPGPERSILWARRLYSHKISSGWQTNNWPVIPKQDSFVFDCETTEGPRRYFVDDQGAVDCVKFFETQTLPALEPIDPQVAVEVFESAWKAFDEEYAKFALVPEVDWSAQRERYLPWAQEARTTFEAGATIGLMLESLRDLHVWVKAGEEHMPGFNRVRRFNGSWSAAGELIGPIEDTKNGLLWGRTEDGIAYLNISSLGDESLADVVDRVLEKLGGTWAAVVDLRFNGGGDEVLAQRIAGRFADEPRVYAISRYRSGPKHDELGPEQPRKVEPRSWRYAGPVVALFGARTMSSAESLAMMLAQFPNVTTMGSRTAGSSANPRKLELPAGIVVNLPRWNDLDPRGQPIEHVGFAPQVEIAARSSQFSPTTDPVLEAALKHLRKTPKAKRKPVREDGASK
jgi:hypothetical protein